ncbi:MAG: tRNA (adenosine(37)-N6)-threonylcarbamoyltransferase complex ATPase subunit type 1 TsaE [Bacteroidales bacterium]|nr:tRNA (adenosine(37)-N6)-threonylcarbamoyltransferase complex ATPase subunit type 1 TsaE [Bacteroidales bacterium]
MGDTFLINGLDDLQDAAKWLMAHIGEQRQLAFEGEMGAGKTTFIQAICRELGVTQEVTSPTFALVNEYSGTAGLVIYHFDFYRLNDPTEALDFGLEDYLSSEAMCLMEWSEKIAPFLPEDIFRVYLDVMPDQTRLLRLS